MSLLIGVWCTLFLLTVNDLNIPVTAQTTIASTSTTGTTRAVQNRNLCLTSLTKVSGKNSCKGKIIFQELFYGLDKWQVENKFAGDPNYEFTIYSNNKTNVFLNNGYLYIRPSFTEERYGAGYITNTTGIDFGQECTGVFESLDCIQKPRAWQILPPVISGQISTKNHFSFVYGNIEIRAKFPKGDWLYPEISLVPKDQYYGPGLGSGRMYVAYAAGNKNLSTFLWSGCNLGYSGDGRAFGMRYINSDKEWYNDFHVYRLQWKIDSIILYVDDEVYGTIYPPYEGFASEPSLNLDSETSEKWQEGSFLAPFDQEMYIVIGVGVGGQMFHEYLKITKPWSNGDPKAQLQFYRKSKEWSSTWTSDSQLIVDYIKVWAI